MSDSIYSLIEQEEVKQQKPPRYVSRFREQAKTEYFAKDKEHGTMGQAKVPVAATDNFLRKRTAADQHLKPTKPNDERFKYPDADRKKPEVPRRHEQPLMGLKTSKNFINSNAVQNITSVPKQPQKIYVDTVKGDKNCLVPSGLEQVYIHKKDYGDTPKYLIKRKDEMQRAQEEYDMYIAEHFRRGAMKQLSQEERNYILNGLRTRWEEIHDAYQSLSVVTDTAPKKNRKERMEAEMKQLERDIESMEKHKVIYISN